MKKTITLLALLLAFVCMRTSAQDRTITGKVTSSQDNLGIPGVAVVVVGTTTGASTDIDGKYSVTVPVTGKQLRFSGVGLKTKVVDVGASDVIDVAMEPDILRLDEVVVTALGISREKKSLGYSTQEVSGEQLSTVKSGNFMNEISGKVSGVQIKNTGNIGGSTNIIIRGTTSLLGDNQALFIVDGVPMDNTKQSVFGQNRGTAGYDYGSPVADINPDDIESINVLKGAAATALYGSRAARGVVLVTTKKGRPALPGAKSRIGVTYNTSYSLGYVDKKTFPTYQNEYGAGYGHYYDTLNAHFFSSYINVNGDTIHGLVTPYTEDASYGEKFDPNLLVYQWDAFVPGSPNFGKQTPWVGHASNEDEGPLSFFETEKIFTNNVAIDGGSDRGTFRISIGNTDDHGILPNSKLERYNFGTNAAFNFTNKFSGSASVNFVRTETTGRNETGYNNNIMTSFRQWYETNVSVKELKDIYEMTKINYGWNPADASVPEIPIFWDNPYFIRWESYSTDARNRLYGNTQLNYKVNNNFDLMGRIGLDTYNMLQEERLAKTSNAKQFGIGSPGQAPADQTSGYSRLNRDVRTTNLDFQAHYKRDLTTSLNFNGYLGASFYRNYLNSILAATNGGLAVDRLYSVSNSVNTPSASEEHEEIRGVNGYYAALSFGFQRYLYLDLSGRMDYSSTLPIDNNNYFYPGASLSFIFSEKWKAKWLEYGKLRLNIAQVGNDAPWNSVNDVYSKPIAFGSTPLFSLPTTKNNSELKPELSLTKEIGLEMEFLKGRVGFDFAAYKTDTKNQILSVAVSPATGYSFKFVNAGLISNKGIELNLHGYPLKWKNNGSWRIDLNWSQNRNKVEELYEGVDNLQIANFQQGVTFNAHVGEAYGTLEGTDYVYLNGQKVITSKGYYQSTTTATNIIGNVNPDWLGGIGNTVTYKKWSFYFLIDMQKGGSVYSLDQAYGQATGLYPESVITNDLGNPVRNTIATGGGVILDGVLADGTPNSIRVAGDNYLLWGYARNPNSAFIYDASYTKLREVTLTYKLPLKEKSFFSNVAFGLTGNNLWIIHKNLPYSDPEAGLASGNVQGYQTGVLPAVKRYGFNLTLQF
jgi:TonB-linked SusC/RagA family outer membrane protein